MGYSSKRRKNAPKTIEANVKQLEGQELEQDAQVLSDEGAELEMKAATLSKKVKDALARSRKALANQEELIPA